jgi:DNA polymerase/3'-5' exonuclease PolX
MSDEKRKWRREDAARVASELMEELVHACPRLAVAGSIRRGRQWVGDVELVYESEPILDLFGERTGDVRADVIIEQWLSRGVLEKRLSKVGHSSWGQEIKLAVHMATGIPVDFFAARPGGWHSYLMCRTGSRIHNEAIAREMMGRSMRWEPYEGVRLRSGELVRVSSEAELYTMIGWPYLEPEEREAERLLARKLIAPCHMPVK